MRKTACSIRVTPPNIHLFTRTLSHFRTASPRGLTCATHLQVLVAQPMTPIDGVELMRRFSDPVSGATYANLFVNLYMSPGACGVTYSLEATECGAGTFTWDNSNLPQVWTRGCRGNARVWTRLGVDNAGAKKHMGAGGCVRIRRRVCVVGCVCGHVGVEDARGVLTMWVQSTADGC